MADIDVPKTISVSHINIRQSISFMLLKLISMEIAFTVLIIMFCFPLACFDIYANPWGQIVSSHTSMFLVLIILKLFISLYIILDWLDEYYEVTPIHIIHHRGIFFKKSEEYTYKHIMSVDLSQSLWGKLLNYGTIHMYDRYISKDIYLNFIHNPQRYFQILIDLIPNIDVKEEIVREHLLEEEAN